MNDDQLDSLLDHDRHDWESGVTTATTTLVYATRHHVDAEPAVATRRRRRTLVIAGIVAGGLALTAGASVTAAQLGIPPFQTLEVGVVRIAAPVPITYTERTGTPVTCQAFMELRNVDNATRARLTAAIHGHDWTGVGQSAYDAARAAGGDQTARATRFSDAVDAALYAEAKNAVPQLVGSTATAGADPKTATWSGFGMSCTAQNNW